MFLALNIAATEIGLPSIYLACGLFESSPASTFAASHPGPRPPTAGARLSQRREKGSPKASPVPKVPAAGLSPVWQQRCSRPPRPSHSAGVKGVFAGAEPQGVFLSWEDSGPQM